ncbi:protein arginine kinase [Fontivita pretiosa]|jgi:protein arginine kinase|uniref:protein arginine kinase n=1 Tax=Fontivita pretiosa TaxID=2989684 RepID=UPI003D169881
MKLSDLTSRAGEWLRGVGPMSEIVISSRIRLARNLAGQRFLTRMTRHQRQATEAKIRDTILAANLSSEMLYVDLETAPEVDRQLLVERHLISKPHAAAEGARGVAIGENETLSIMVNEEDHLRIQVLRSGLQLEEAWEQINAVDDKLEARLDFAFHPRFGYLTACPTNVGTGIRVSVMLHLPALKLTGEIEKVFRAAKDMRLAVRGLYGEGTEATGDFYQISNQTTLGKSEEEIISDFKHVVIPKIIDYEHHARRTLLNDRTVALDDKVCRALGVLRSARLLTSEEVMFLLSHLRMGINLGRIKEIDIRTINELFLLSQPAHLQKLQGRKLEGDLRRAARADFIRQRLNGN